MSTAIAPRVWNSMMERMANPWTAVTRVALAVALLVAIWFQAVPVIVVLSVAILTNPWWFRARAEPVGWLARVVAGMQVWTRETPIAVQAPIYVASTAVAAVLVWALWTQQLALSLVLFAAFVAVKVGFFMHFAQLAGRQNT